MTLDSLKLFWARYHKPVLAGAVICLCVGSYAIGRYATAPEVVYQEKVVEVEVEKVVEVEKIVEKKVYVASTQKRERRHTTEVKAPDGTVTKTETVDTGEKTDVKTTEDRATERVVEKEVVKYVDREVQAARTNPPDWKATPLLGANLPAILGAKAFDPLKQLSAGLNVERRIAGPFSAGVWGLSSGQVGVSVTIEF